MSAMIKDNGLANGREVCVVTGANTGVGYAIAREMAKRGYHVVLACRDAGRANDAVKRIIAERKVAENQLEVILLDLTDFASVRRFVAEFQSKHSALHVLIENAAVVLNQTEISADGFEKTLQANHLGHFLLYHLLLPFMLPGPSRLIIVGSDAHTFIGKLDLHELEHVVPQINTINCLKYYARSKLCNMLCGFELERQLKGTGLDACTVNIVHPGAVNTDINRQAPIWLSIFAKPVMKFFFLTPDQGAATVIKVATDDNLRECSGLYWANGSSKSAAANATDTKTAAELWQLCIKWVKLDASEVLGGRLAKERARLPRFDLSNSITARQRQLHKNASASGVSLWLLCAALAAISAVGYWSMITLQK